MNNYFFCSFFGHNDVNARLQRFGVFNPLPGEGIDCGCGKVDVGVFKLDFFYLVVADEGDVSDEAEAGVINLMENMVLDLMN